MSSDCQEDNIRYAEGISRALHNVDVFTSTSNTVGVFN